MQSVWESSENHSKRYITIAGFGLLGLLSFFAGFYQDAITTRLILMLLLACLASLFVMIPDRWALRLMFLYLSFEGMAKLLTGYNPVIHVGMDLLMLVLTAKCFILLVVRKRNFPQHYPPLVGLFILHFIWFFIQFANPNTLGIVPSLAAAKIYITMNLLFAYGFYLANDPKEVEIFFYPWIIGAVVNIALGLYQAHIGPLSVLGLSPSYAWVLQKYEGYAFRPFGTSSQPGGAGMFVQLSFMFVLYFVLSKGPAIKRLLLAAIIPLGIMLLLFCQVRVLLFKIIIGTSIFVFLNVFYLQGRARRRLLIGIPTIAGLMLVSMPFLTQFWLTARDENVLAMERTLSVFDVQRIRESRSGTLDRIITFAKMVPFGAGLSRTGSAGEVFAKKTTEKESDPFLRGVLFTDNFWASTIADIGIPGSFILTLIVLIILLRAFRGIRECADSQTRLLQITLFSSLVMLMFGAWGSEAILYNPEAAFFWFFGGAAQRIRIWPFEKFE